MEVRREDRTFLSYDPTMITSKGLCGVGLAHTKLMLGLHGIRRINNNASVMPRQHLKSAVILYFFHKEGPDHRRNCKDDAVFIFGTKKNVQLSFGDTRDCKVLNMKGIAD